VSRCSTVAIVSPYFSPSTLAGVHRARHLAKHLPAHGWHPIIVCVDEAFHEQRLDSGLLKLVPDTVEVVKTTAIPLWLTRPFGLGEISLRAWRPLKRALFDLLCNRAVDVVMITGSPFYPMWLAVQLKRHFDVPVVLDFQDPWVSHWGAQQPFLSKAGISYRLARWLEPKVAASADFITSVSQIQNEEMAARYPRLDSNRMAAIPIGGDPEDFALLRAGNLSVSSEHLQANAVNFSYVGTLMPHTTPLVRVLFKAIKELSRRNPDLARGIRVNFIGTSNQPDDTGCYPVSQLAIEEGVADIVHEVPERRPFLEALNVLTNSDGLLLIGSEEPHYTASKIYPAMMSGTPYLSLFHEKSSSHRILTAAGGGFTFSFDSTASLGYLVEQLAEGLELLATKAGNQQQINPQAYSDYTADAVAKRYAEIFNGMVSYSQ